MERHDKNRIGRGRGKGITRIEEREGEGKGIIRIKHGEEEGKAASSCDVTVLLTYLVCSKNGRRSSAATQPPQQSRYGGSPLQVSVALGGPVGQSCLREPGKLNRESCKAWDKRLQTLLQGGLRVLPHRRSSVKHRLLPWLGCHGFWGLWLSRECQEFCKSESD